MSKQKLVEVTPSKVTDKKCRFNNCGKTDDCGKFLYRDLDGCLICPQHDYMTVNNL